ncbi:hypothetical protein ACFLT7_08275 [candidate division KSB1 bacterium]
MERYYTRDNGVGTQATAMPVSDIMIRLMVMALSLLGVVVLLPLITGVTLVPVGIR